MRNPFGLLLCISFVAVTAQAEDNLRFGQPACSGRVMDKTYYVVCYNPDRKVPVWVGYALTQEDLAHKATGRTEDFRPDPDLKAGERAELSDYLSSGYDRGHMAPAADFERSAVAMSTTFLLSNMAPQRPNLNRGIWSKLEEAIRDLARAQGAVWIFTGPVFVGDKPIGTIGKDQVAVPSHCFKVALWVHTDNTKEMFAAVMPNTKVVTGDLAHFAQTVRAVEKLTGLDFFSALPQEEQDKLEVQGNPLPAH